MEPFKIIFPVDAMIAPFKLAWSDAKQSFHQFGHATDPSSINDKIKKTDSYYSEHEAFYEDLHQPIIGKIGVIKGLARMIAAPFIGLAAAVGLTLFVAYTVYSMNKPDIYETNILYRISSRSKQALLTMAGVFVALISVAPLLFAITASMHFFAGAATAFFSVLKVIATPLIFVLRMPLRLLLTAKDRDSEMGEIRDQFLFPIRALGEPFKHSWLQVKETFRPYQSHDHVAFDLKQPLRALRGLLYGAERFALSPVVGLSAAVYTAFELPRQLYRLAKSFDSKSFILPILAVGLGVLINIVAVPAAFVVSTALNALYGAATFLFSAAEFLTTPLTYALRLPFRGLMTRSEYNAKHQHVSTDNHQLNQVLQNNYEQDKSDDEIFDVDSTETKSLVSDNLEQEEPEYTLKFGCFPW